MPAEGVSLIAFTSALGGDFEIFVVEPSGQYLLQLTDNDAQDFAPAWTPDGMRIAFHSDRDGNDELYMMSADGSDLVRLTNDLASDTFPAWSPDGTLLAFISGRGGKADLWMVSLETGNLTQLTDDDADPANPVWSPDGTRIAYTASVQGQGSVRVVAVDTTLAVSEVAQNAFYPDWSPDGTLAFAAQEADLNIFLAQADGSNATRLTQEPSQQHSPSFSSDGSQIVFVQQADVTSDLWVMNADGTGLLQITQNMNPLMPRWSP
jgi:TolB protein